MKIVGIYKITSPSGKIYIGQSIDIYKRFNHYKTLDCKGQVKLYNSFKKYGIDNHILEIAEECSIELLNDKERYWQDFYDVISKGLNLTLTNCKTKTGKHSNETKLKIKIANNKLKTWTGRKHSEASKLKMSESSKKQSTETRNKISQTKKGTTVLSTRGFNHHNSKTVLCINSGIFYGSARLASIAYNLRYDNLKQKLSGRIKNNTNLIYV